VPLDMSGKSPPGPIRFVILGLTCVPTAPGLP
jgi:hypothetical protein